jgi:hypothetical protein
VTVRPVAGVWASVDSRPVPPLRGAFAGCFFGVAVTDRFFGAGRLALDTAARLVGADDLFAALLAFFAVFAFRGAARLTAFFFDFRVAWRAGFRAIFDSVPL